MPKLIIETGASKGREVKLPPGNGLSFGRDASADVCLDDPLVSRAHFRVKNENGGFVLTDLGSRNGTQVNGERIDACTLKPGDTIQAGEMLLTFAEDILDTRTGGMAGKVVAGCRIEERVGKGGMGTVYRAIQLSLGRPVALKVLSESLTGDAKFIKRFTAEAKAAAQLNHPNVVQVYDAGNFGGFYYMSMEFVPGGSVKDLINREKRVPPQRATEIVTDAARALDYAEKKGIVHKDIKPDNLMITEDGRTKIADLGLAEKVGGEKAKQMRGFAGSPHYVSPEQAQAQPVDHRADIYSLGATFYHMLAGRTPFSASTVQEILQKQIHEDPDPLTKVNPQVPSWMGRIVAKMMAKDPEARFESASEVITAIEKRGAGVGAAGGPGRRGATRGRTTARPAPRARRKQTSGKKITAAGVIGAIIILALLLATILALYAHSQKVELHKAVRDLLTRAEHAEEQNDYAAALALYKQALTRSPNGPLQDQASTKVTEVTGKLARAQRVGGSAAVAYQRARHFDTENPTRTSEVIAAYRQLIDIFPATSEARSAARRIRGLHNAERQRQAQLRGHRETYDTAVKEAEQIAAKQRFGDAIARLERVYGEVHRDSTVGRMVQREVARLRDLARAAFRRVDDEARALAEGGNLQRAIARYQEATAMFGMRELSDEATRIIAELRANRGNKAAQAWSTAKRRAREMAQGLQFKAAADTLNAVAASYASIKKDTGAMTMIGTYTDRAQLQQQAIAELKKKGAEHPFLTLEKVGKIKLAGATKNGILQSPRPAVTTHIAWSQLTPRDFCRLCRLCPLERRHKITLARYCLDHGVFEEALPLCRELSDTGELPPDLKKRLADLAAKRDAQRKREVDTLITQVQAAIDGNDTTTALQLLQTVAKDYDDVADERLPELARKAREMKGQAEQRRAAVAACMRSVTADMSRIKAQMRERARKLRLNNDSRACGRYLVKMEEYAMGINSFLKYTNTKTRDPNTRDTYLALAWAYARRNHKEGAKQALNQAMAMATHVSKSTESRDSGKRAIQREANRIKQYMDNLVKKGPEIQALEAQLKKEPDDLKAWWSVCQMTRDIGWRVQERKALLAIQALFPEDERVQGGEIAYRIIANRIYFEDGTDRVLAYTDFQRRFPGHPANTKGETTWAIASDLRSRGEYARAIRYYETMLEKYHQHWAYRRNEGEGRYIRGIIADCRKAMRG